MSSTAGTEKRAEERLRASAVNGEITGTRLELARIVGINASNLSHAVRSLEQKGVLVATVLRDGRRTIGLRIRFTSKDTSKDIPKDTSGHFQGHSQGHFQEQGHLVVTVSSETEEKKTTEDEERNEEGSSSSSRRDPLRTRARGRSVLAQGHFQGHFVSETNDGWVDLSEPDPSTLDRFLAAATSVLLAFQASLAGTPSPAPSLAAHPANSAATVEHAPEPFDESSPEGRAMRLLCKASALPEQAAESWILRMRGYGASVRRAALQETLVRMTDTTLDHPARYAAALAGKGQGLDYGPWEDFQGLEVAEKRLGETAEREKEDAAAWGRFEESVARGKAESVARLQEIRAQRLRAQRVS